jgi:hypothetical protein
MARRRARDTRTDADCRQGDASGDIVTDAWDFHRSVSGD